MSSREISQSAVGISLSLEKVALALHHQQMGVEGGAGDGTWSGTPSLPKISPLDAVVCCTGQICAMTREMACIVRDLWSAGIRSSPLDSLQKIEDIQDYCQDLGIPHIIILKDTETGTVRVSTWERDRYNERKVNVCDLVEHMQKVIRNCSFGENILGCDVNIFSGNIAELSGKGSLCCGDGSQGFMTSVPTTPSSNSTSSALSSSPSSLTSSFSQFSSGNPSGSTTHPRASVNFHIVTTEKLALHIRRRYENLMINHINSVILRLSPRVRVEVLGIQLEGSAIRTIVSLLDMDGDEKAYEASVSLIVERLPRHRKYLTRLCDEVHDLKFEKNCAVIILYSLTDNTYKLLM